MELVGPGALVTCGVMVLAICVAPWLTAHLCVAAAARSAALILLPVHVLAGALLLLYSRRSWPPILSVAVLMLDAAGAGLLLGSDFHLMSPGWPAALVVLLMILVTGGERAALSGVLLLVLGAGGSMFGRLPALLAAAPVDQPAATLLEVETDFGGSPASALAVTTVATELSIERSFAGSPVCGATTELLMPALAIALLSTGIGTGVAIMRLRMTLARCGGEPP